MFQNYTIIDLTHIVTPDIATWPGTCGYKPIKILDYDDVRTGPQFKVYTFELYASAGTHMDAPSHCIKGGLNISQIPIEQLILPLFVIDVSSKCFPEYAITVNDILEFENKYGKITPNSLVVGYTGWSKFWEQPEKYRNADTNGKMHFPKFSAEAANLLIDRDVAAIGIDTLSPDGSDYEFPVHQIILKKNKYIIENVANCDKVPAIGALAIVFPLKLDQATESPIRCAALIPK